MNTSFDFSTYLSPFTTRYGSNEMRVIWSEKNKRLLWRKVWVALAKGEHKAGLISKRELDDISAHQNTIDVPKSKEREKEVYHELMSEIQVFSESCKIGGGKIHLGATSADILDAATTIQVKQALAVTKRNLIELLNLFAKKIKQYEDIVCMGYTHLQPAEPITLGYRFSFYAQELLSNLLFLVSIEPLIKTKGMKGAVGTYASYSELLKGTNMTPEDLETFVLKELGIEAVSISNQTYPRSIDALVIEALANIATTLHKFNFDFRIMQSANFDEWMEKRNSKRVGSSAMPFKRNPDRAEKICSLCRYVISLVPLALNNPANSLLERTLDDSATQRIFLPESFLALDASLTNTIVLLKNLEINLPGIQKNLDMFGTFASTEPLLMELVKKGANRQTMHELIKSCSMKAWKGRGDENQTLPALLAKEEEIIRFIKPAQLEKLTSSATHVGIAKERTKKFLRELQKTLATL